MEKRKKRTYEFDLFDFAFHVLVFGHVIGIIGDLVVAVVG